MNTGTSEREVVEEKSESLFRGPFVSLCVSNSLGWLGAFFLYPVLPLYVRRLGGGDVAVGVVGGAFGIASIAGRLITSATIERWGRRPLLLGGMAASAIAMLLYEVTPAVPALVFVRVLHGIATAMATTTGTVLAADLASQTRRGEGLGYYAVGGNVATAVGPSLAWLLMGVTSLPLQKFSLVFAGGALAYCVATLLVLPVPNKRSTSASRALPVKTGVLAKSFHRAALVPALVMFGACFVYSSVLYFLPLAAADRGGNVAPYFVAYALGATASRPLLGRYADRIGPATVVVPSLFVMAVGVALLGIEPTGATMLTAGILQGVGFGGAWVSMMTLAVNVVSPDDRGGSVATQQMGSDAGLLAGSFASGGVAEFAGYSGAFLGASMVVAVTLVGFLVFGRRNSGRESVA